MLQLSVPTKLTARIGSSAGLCAAASDLAWLSVMFPSCPVMPLCG